MEMAATNNIESILRNSFDRFPDVALAVLFGSAASGRMRGDSDVDIAIAGDSAFSWDRLQEARIVLCRELHREVDLVDLNVSKGLIFYQALTKGRIVVSRNRDLLLRCMREAVYFGEDVLPLMKQAYATKIRRFTGGC